MTDQETFDTVARHLLTQAARSTDGTRCLYRGHDGLKCAVGCLISDEEYRPEMEGWLVPSVSIDNYASLLADWARQRGFNAVLLRALQDVHDYADVAQWSLALVGVAARFSLSAAVVGEFHCAADEPVVVFKTQEDLS